MSATFITHPTYSLSTYQLEEVPLYPHPPTPESKMMVHAHIPLNHNPMITEFWGLLCLPIGPMCL